jgi:AcrR family transcriptional regulator
MIENRPNGALAQRVKPLQKRSKETVELILNTALDLLIEIGADAFTTKLLAERANIRVRNIYRYFPNKHSLFSALAERMAEKEITFIDNFSAIQNQKLSWTEAWNKTIDSFINAALAEPGMMEVRIAMQGNPDLRIIDERHKQNLTKKLVIAFKNRGTRLPEEKLHLVCVIILDTTNALLNRAVTEFSITNNKSKIFEMVEEIKRLLNNYIQSYL